MSVSTSSGRRSSVPAVRRIATGPEADGVAMRVDTGIGIPATQMPRVFERFHRVPGAEGRSYEGSGIGLALVHDIGTAGLS